MEYVKNGLIIIAVLVFIYRQIFPNGFLGRYTISDYNFAKKIIGGELYNILIVAGADISYLISWKNGEKWDSGLPIEKIRIYDYKKSSYNIEFVENALADFDARIYEDILDKVDIENGAVLNLKDYWDWKEKREQRLQEKEMPFLFYHSYKAMERRNVKSGIYLPVRDKYGKMTAVLALEYANTPMLYSGHKDSLYHYSKSLKRNIQNIAFMLQNQPSKLPKNLQDLRKKTKDSAEYMAIFFKNFIN